MKKMLIKINDISDVSAFVNQATKIEKDVTIYKGRYVINGKSLLGMFSLDLTTGVFVEFPEDEKDFEIFLESLQEKNADYKYYDIIF